MDIGFHTRVGNEGRSYALKNAPPADRSCSSSLNGSDLEQMFQNRIGRLSLEWVAIWNESL